MPQGKLRPQFTHNVAKSVVSDEELALHLQACDTPQLLLTAIHITGDASLLDRYADRVGTPSGPRRATVQSAKQPVAADPEARRELEEIVSKTLTQEDQPTYIGVEDRVLFGRMADVIVAMHVDEKYISLYLEQCGFVPDQRAIPVTKAPPKTLNLAIIGAGMTGLDAAVKATDRGFDFEVFDQAGGVGGLWWSQTYPGVAVDTPSLFYSLSWEVTPNWSRYFPLGAEYRAYLASLADKYGLNEKLRFNSEITRMEWIDSDQVWELTVFDTVTHESRIVRAAAVITGAGHLNRPKYPDVPERDSFAGEQIHTADWRDVDVAGKRVAVVGAGAAGVQVVASLAGTVGHLTLFQRQPHWVVPNNTGDGIVSESERWLRAHLPYYIQWSRFKVFWSAGDELGYPAMRVDEDWIATHPDSDSISASNDAAKRVALKYINDSFGEGTELARAMTPDFVFGGKRPVRDPGDFEPGGYFYALAQPHVDVVTSGIARMVPEGFVTADGTVVELDVIIYATGMTLDFLSPIEIIGRDGVRLNDLWAGNNPRTYLGGTVPGFPNLFVNDGPNTGVGHAGAHNFMTETVDHYAFECLQLMVESDASSIEVTQIAHDDHNDRLEARMQGSIWAYERRADTYYRNEAGRIILPSPWRLVEYWEMSQVPDESKFILRKSADVLDAVAG